MTSLSVAGGAPSHTKEKPAEVRLKKVEFAAAVQEMQEQDSVEDPPAACRHGKDALGRPVVADGLGRLCGLVVRSPFGTCL